MDGDGSVLLDSSARLELPLDIQPLVVELETSVIDGLRRYVWAGALVLLVTAGVELLIDRALWLLFVLFASVLPLLLGTTATHLPHRTRKLLVVVGVTSMSGIALLHFGPQFGVGVFFVLTILLATFFFGVTGSVFVSIALALFVGLLAIGTIHDFISPTYEPPNAHDWIRIALNALVGSATATYVTLRIVAGMRDAMVSKRRSERAEEAARSTREKAQAERENLLRQSLASQQLESIGRLAGGVAHDFNNALMVIRAGVEYLQLDRALDPKEAAQVFGEVERAVNGACDTSRQLLAFARPRPEDAGACFPADLLKRFASSVRRMLPETVRIEVDAAPTAAIPLSAAALEQVLLNLTLNARDAMPSGGTIFISSAFEQGTNAVTISVRDTGTGIPDEVRARIFEPFFTTKKERGTGLGLAMVWGMITHAGGTISLDDTVASGTKFDLRFEAAMRERKATPTPLRPSATLRSRHVLLLEDEPDVLRAMTRMLMAGGYQVTAFDRTEPATASLASSAYDILITDVVVPDGGVPHLIAAFKERYPQGTTLVCSGHVDEELVRAGIEAGDYRLLRKPFSMYELHELLSQLQTG